MDKTLRETIKARCLAEPAAMYANLEDSGPYSPPMVTLHTGEKVPAVLVELWHGMMYHAAAEQKDNNPFSRATRLSVANVRRSYW